MTEQERKAALWDMISANQQQARTVACLESQARRFSKPLCKLGEALGKDPSLVELSHDDDNRFLLREPLRNSSDSVDLDIDRLREVLSELDEANSEKARMEQEMQKAGLERFIV